MKNSRKSAVGTDIPAHALTDEYDLPQAMTVAGTYKTRRIAVTNDAIVAIRSCEARKMTAFGSKFRCNFGNRLTYSSTRHVWILVGFDNSRASSITNGRL